MSAQTQNLSNISDYKSTLSNAFQNTHFIPLTSKIDYRFYRVMEITEGTAQQQRLAMANVISALNNSQKSMVYILSGTPQGIQLYVGVASQNDASDAGLMLKNAFEGNFLGSKLTELKTDSLELEQIFSQTKYLGLVMGTPSFNEDENNLEGKDFQGVERLANMLSDTHWQMVIVAESSSDDDVYAILDQIYALSTQLSSKVKLSVQDSKNETRNEGLTEGTSETKTEGKNDSESKTKSWGASKTKTETEGKSSSSSNSSKSTAEGTNDGKSEATTKGTSQSTAKGVSYSKTKGVSNAVSSSSTVETINKRIEQIHTHLNDTQINRFRFGLSKGMFRTAIYISAEKRATFERLSNGVKSIFQGSQPSFSPLYIAPLSLKDFQNKGQFSLNHLLQIRKIAAEKFIANNIGALITYSVLPQYDHKHICTATWLNTSELALLAGLPTLELPGLKLRKSVAFALNTVDYSTENNLRLGHLVQDGRRLEKKVEIPLENLNKHVFVTGVTGSGKTTTCMKILLESQLPFTVIEPAKTEYRALYGKVDNIQYYALGREDLCTFRLNPFELMPQQNLSGHISMLKATMSAVFPMEASMPFIVEQAIIKAYEKRGWDIASNENYLVDDPWNSEESVFPTFSDMIAELDDVIKSAKMGAEFTEKYRGSLVSRLTSLTDGIKGIMINTPRSINFDQLLDQKVVIELEELKDEEDKAFFMGIIIGRLAECMKQRHKKSPHFKHITLVEEAHRLLSKPEFGSDGAKKLGVDMFANLLAEVRKYGESLVIADQIPNKLVTDVIKNTNTKIVHRLFAADDRNAIGDAMGLEDKQKDFLPLLQAGETIIYSGGWHASVRAQIDQLANTTAAEIDETLIKQQGEQQLWENRDLLFPRTSQFMQQIGVLNAERYTQLLKRVRKQLNMLINILKAQKAGYTKTDATIRLRLERLREQCLQDCETFTLTQEQLMQLHMLVLFDTKTLGVEGNFQQFMGDYQIFYPSVFEGLLTSEEKFLLAAGGARRFLYSELTALDQRNPI